MNILVACDSFKGSLSSIEVAENIKKGILSLLPDANVDMMSIADGGEGTMESLLLNNGGKIHIEKVKDPLFFDVDAEYGILSDGSAIIEMAKASGLPLVIKKDIYKANTYGTGQLIKAALDHGCKTIYIGIGGSATNDGGMGMADALGIEFLNDEGIPLPPVARSLPQIRSINMDRLDPRIKDTEIIVMCDVDNPLCGPSGASAVYGPQKGASKAQIQYLDQGLENLANVVKETGLVDARDMPGAGAAGGLGFGLVTFLNARLERGIDVILKANAFEEKLDNYDLIITGEGRIDFQSIHGKVPTGISKLAKKHQKPVVAIVGSIGKNAKLVYDYGISTIESCVYAPCELEEALAHASENVENAANRLMRAILLGMSMKAK